MIGMEKPLQEENEKKNNNLKFSKKMLTEEFTKLKKLLNQVGDGKYSFEENNVPQSKLKQKIQSMAIENIQIKASEKTAGTIFCNFLDFLKIIQEESWIISCPKIMKVNPQNKTINALLKIEYFGNPIKKLLQSSMGQVQIGDCACQLIPINVLKSEESSFKNGHFNGFTYLKYLLFRMVFSDESDSLEARSLKVAQIEIVDLDELKKDECLELLRNEGDKTPLETYERVFVSRDSSSDNLLDDGSTSCKTINDDEIY